MTRRSWRASLPGGALVAAFVLLGFLPLAILTASSIVLSKRAVTREARARVQSLNISYATLINDSVSGLPRALTETGTQPSVQAAVRDARTRPQEADAVIATLLQSRPDLESAFVTDPAGIAVAPAGTASLSNLDWHRGAARSDSAYLSAAYLAADKSLGQVVAVAMKVTTADPGQPGTRVVAGYLVAIYRFTTLQATVDTLQETDGASVSITDQAGVVLSAPGKPQTSMVSKAGDPGVAAALAGRSGVLTAPSPNGPVLTAYGPVGQLGWSVSVNVSEKSAFAAYYRLRGTVLSLAGVLAALMLAGLFVAGRAQARRRTAEADSASRELDLAASEQRFRSAFTHAAVGVVRMRVDGIISDANLAFCDLVGIPADRIVGRDIADFALPEDLLVAHQLIIDLKGALGVAVQTESRLISSTGEVRLTLMSAVRLADASGEVYTLAQVIDISERKRAEVLLSRQALHDVLTGLPNRVLLENRIEHALARLNREAVANLAVLFIDLDGFKEVNDQLGHHVGDEVLREVAARLQHVIRPGDTVARLGGDEFVVLCEALSDSGVEVASQVAGRVLRTITQPGGAGEQAWQVSASIGISRHEGPATTSKSLIAHADAAMYRAKQQGKNRFEIYDASMASNNSAAPMSLALVQTAIAKNRLRLHYQPVYDLATRTVVGAESLIRMVDDEGRVLAPAEFLAAAEAHGQIVEFGAWSLRQACQQAAAWKRVLGPDREFAMAVNMSVKELEDAGFLPRVDRALELSGLAPDALVIELTESAFLRDIPSGRQAVEGLRERGVKLALDDFGTGFSSLSYLRRFHVDIIKLDRSFVSDLLTDPDGARVTRGLIALAHKMKATLVAEGVEEEAQVDVLLGLNATLAQGYLLSRPLPAKKFSALLERAAAPAR